MIEILEYLAPIAMIFIAVALGSMALLIITSRADRRQDEMNAHQAMRRALSDEHTIRHSRQRWF